MPLDLSIDSLEEVVLKKLSSSELKKLLAEISQKFTSNRDNISDYTISNEHVSAYTYFYLPTNIPKYKFLLDQLSDETKSKIEKSHFIDFGCGPGTFSLAHLDYFQASSKISLVDTSKVMLNQSRACLEGLFPHFSDASYYDSYKDINIDKSENRTLLFGHSINEMGVELSLKVIEYINPDTLIFISPGTPSVFKDLLRIRKSLHDKGFNSKYPCSSARLPCPLEAVEDDWCHQILKLKHHPSVERLSQLISKDRRTMPLIAHVYENKASSSDKVYDFDKEEDYIITRTLNETKFSFLLEVCIYDKNINKQQKIEVLKKPLSKREIKEFRGVSTGLKVKFTRTKILDDLTWRGFINLKD